MDPQLLTNLPASAAVIVVVGLFLKHMVSERAQDRIMWTNHLQDIAKTLDALREAITELRVAIEKR